jgi:type II secretory pathway component PulJ
MLATLLQFTGLNKLWPYLVLGSVIVLTIAAVYVQGQRSARAASEAMQLNDWLNTRYKEAKDRAAIQSMRSTDVRKQLRDRWSKK